MMTTADLEKRLLQACFAETSVRTVARNRALVVAHWLRAQTASDQPVSSYASRATVARRRRLLRRAGLLPVTTGDELAWIAHALRVPADDRDTLVRLAWALRDNTGGLRFSDAEDRFSELVDEAQRILRHQATHP